MGFGSTLGLLFEINADPDHAVAALEIFQEQIATSLGVTNKQFDEFKDVAGAAAKDLAMIGAGVGAAAAGFLKLAEHAAEAGNQIYGAAQKTGMSAEALSGVMALAKETGHSFDEIANTFARAGRNIAEAADTGKGALTDLFTQAQLQSLKLKPVDEQMHIVLSRIFAITNAGERNRELQALLGRGWMENVGILKMLATEGYAPAIEKAKEFGVFFDASAARDAHNFMKEMDTLKAEMSGLALAVGKEFMPYAEMFLAWLHTAKTDAEVFGLRLVALSVAIVNPIAAIVALHKATKLETAAIQEQTDWLSNLQKQMKAAADASKEFGDAQTGAAGAGVGAAAVGGAPGKFPTYGPPAPDWMKPKPDVFAGVAMGASEAVQSIHLWEDAMDRALTQLPIAQQQFKVFSATLAAPNVALSGDFGLPAKQGAAHDVASAAQSAKITIDGLAASMDNAGGKSSAMSEKFIKAAQAMAEMAQKAQEAADKGEKLDPTQQVAGMVQIAAAAILTYKERALVESVYYAAKSAAAFAAQDYWAGAEFALASGLFAEAAGTASKASSSGGAGGNQSSYGDSPGSGGGGSGTGGGGGGGRGPTIVWNQNGPMVGTMADLARTLVGVQNALVGSGQLKVIATNALTNGPKQT